MKAPALVVLSILGSLCSNAQIVPRQNDLRLPEEQFNLQQDAVRRIEQQNQLDAQQHQLRVEQTREMERQQGEQQRQQLEQQRTIQSQTQSLILAQQAAADRDRQQVEQQKAAPQPPSPPEQVTPLQQAAPPIREQDRPAEKQEPGKAQISPQPDEPSQQQAQQQQLVQQPGLPHGVPHWSVRNMSTRDEAGLAGLGVLVAALGIAAGSSLRRSRQ